MLIINDTQIQEEGEIYEIGWEKFGKFIVTKNIEKCWKNVEK